jgi:hypothetical protein
VDVPEGNDTVMDLSAAQVWLTRLWWVVVPPFGLLVSRLAFERACAAPYQLLAEIASQPSFAWPLAVLYLSAHLWAIAAYLVTVERTDTLAPSVRVIRALWGPEAIKLAVTAAVLTVEYASIRLWSLVGHSLLGCRP